MTILEQLKALSEKTGVSGAEGSVSAYAAQQLGRFSETVCTDVLGNVYARIGLFDPEKPTLLLDGHMDEIGMIITHIDEEGFIRVGNCGGVDRRVLPAQQVTIHGEQKYKGVVCSTPPHLSKEEKPSFPAVDELYIDAGFSAEDLAGKVAPGDKVTVDANFCELMNGRVCGKALDDRSGMAAILLTLERIKEEQETSACNVLVLFSVQEEIREAGAHAASSYLDADYALSIDVSFGWTPDTPEYSCGELGKGVMIGYSPTLSYDFSRRLTALATKMNIPHQIEVMPGITSTNADVIGVSRGGVRTGTLSIPLRYMHTPVETLEIDDIKAVSDLLCILIKEGVSDHE